MLGSVPATVAMTCDHQARRNREMRSCRSLRARQDCRVRGGLGRALGFSRAAQSRMSGSDGQTGDPRRLQRQAPFPALSCPICSCPEQRGGSSTSGPGRPAWAPAGCSQPGSFPPGPLLPKTSCLQPGAVSSSSCPGRKHAQHGPGVPGVRFGTFAWERSENRGPIGGPRRGRESGSAPLRQADSNPPGS